MYYTEVVNGDSSVSTYMHDQPELEESKTIYTMVANGFAWTNSGWNNGSPVWQYGFTKEGNAIYNKVCAYGMTVEDPNIQYRAVISPTAFEIQYRDKPVVTVNGEESVLTKTRIEKSLDIGRIRFFPHVTNGTVVGTDIAFIDGRE